MHSMTPDQILQMAPAALAGGPKPGLSSRYAFLSTAEAIRIHGDLGWLPVSARQTCVRKEENRGFTRHQITFRRPDDRPVRELGDVVPEIRLVNNHAGQGSYRIHAGLMRLVCLNGMVVPASTVDTLRVRHTLQEARELAGMLATITARLPRLFEVAYQWQQVRLDPGRETALAAAGLRLRYGEREERWPVTPEVLSLIVRRPSDDGNDLWNVFNRIQENLVRGGAHVPGKVDARGRRRRILPVRGIREEIRINQGLWAAAETMGLVA